MDPPFRVYTRQVSYVQAVCACLRHATPKEKDAVAQELQDHLADHADALVEAGWDPEEAQAHALAAMGEAKEVGRALDGNFPSVAGALPAGLGGAGAGHRRSLALPLPRRGRGGRKPPGPVGSRRLRRCPL